MKLRAFYHEPPPVVCKQPSVQTQILQAAPSLLVSGAFLAVLAKQTRFNAPRSQVKPESIATKFADIAGARHAKLELQEVVDFLKNPQKFDALGAKIPRGCLLVGPPGLGKTLIARAIAGEANVPFFACSASEFIEMYIGVGASRIRELFAQAKKHAPAIIFIDELEAIGRARATSHNSDERDQTINQLLTELDGFTPNTGIIILAATNRPEILDAALMRPGRFDRHIHFEPPTLEDREAILELHTANKPLHPSVCLNDIAKITTGLSGAELANIANEAAILAARNDQTHITQEHFDAAYDRITLGHEKPTLVTHRKKKIMAAHEAGHAVTALKVGEFNEISKVSIIPRGKAGGITLFEQTNTELHTRQYLENRLIVALGGRAAEELVFGTHHVTTGSASDLEYVERIARAMITQFGYTSRLSPSAWTHPDISPFTLNQIDKEIQQITADAYKKAKNILENNEPLFNAIADALMTHEVLSQDDLKKFDAMYQTM